MARHQLRVCMRTRGSPRSLRLRSFSCRLLVVSFAPGSSDAASEDVAAERPRTMGEMTPLQSLNTAYRGICRVGVAWRRRRVKAGSFVRGRMTRAPGRRGGERIKHTA